MAWTVPQGSAARAGDDDVPTPVSIRTFDDGGVGPAARKDPRPGTTMRTDARSTQIPRTVVPDITPGERVVCVPAPPMAGPTQDVPGSTPPQPRPSPDR